MKLLTKLIFSLVLLFAGTSVAGAAAPKKKGGYTPTGFAVRLKNATWVTSHMGFKRPSFMKEYIGVEEDYCATFQQFSWGPVQLVFALLGNWATDNCDYPLVGKPVAEGVFIKRITYATRNKNFCSGYTNDGRIFYLHRICMDENSPCLYMVSHISPKLPKERHAPARSREKLVV